MAETGPGALTAEHVGQQTIARSFHLTPRLIMAYAASIKDSNPRFFDDLSGPLTAHPFLAFTFQWATRFSPQIPANPRAAPYGVHAATDLRLARSMVENDLITMQGQLMSTRAIRPGVINLSRYTMTDAAGTTVGVLDQTGITRGATLEGAASTVVMEELVKADGEGGVVAVDPAGRVALVFNTPGMYRASIDAAGHKVVGIYGEDEAP